MVTSTFRRHEEKNEFIVGIVTGNTEWLSVVTGAGALRVVSLPQAELRTKIREKLGATRAKNRAELHRNQGSTEKKIIFRMGKCVFPCPAL